MIFYYCLNRVKGVVDYKCVPQNLTGVKTTKHQEKSLGISGLCFIAQWLMFCSQR